MKTPQACFRCGIIVTTETDRIVPGIEGGKYTPENTRELCPACHQLRHKASDIAERLTFESDPIRIDIFLKRLEIIIKHNTPQLVRVRQSYQSYFEFYGESLPAQRKEFRIIPKMDGEGSR